MGPARGSIEELDHVVGGADHPGLDVRRAKGAGQEALEDGAPRGQLGRGGEHVFVVLVGGIRRGAGSAHVRDRGQELRLDEGREIAGGRGERPARVKYFIHDDHVIYDEVIDVVTGPTT